MSRLNVMTILGTRPEIIRLACVMEALDKATNHTIVHTGQNYDYELNQIFFDDLGIRKPDHFMGVDTSSLGTVLGGILVETEKLLREHQPDAVVILGDTNSALAGIMARRLKIPLYHMEAGNRCFDMNVPEETNRRIIDHISDFNLVYTEHARRHLLAEGFPHRRIYVTGSPMREVLNRQMSRIDASNALQELNLTPQKYFLVSMHREENVDSPVHLSKLLQGLSNLAEGYGFPVVVSTHPRTQKRLDALEAETPEGIRFMKPFGFSDYNRLQKDAFCVISDSGTISEESSILRFPAVTIRNAIERPEALDTGSIVLTGTDPDRIIDCVRLVTDEHAVIPPCPADYEIEDTSQRVVRLIAGTAQLTHRWMGIESPAESKS